MNKLNPLLDVMSELDDKTVADLAAGYARKRKKPWKIVVIAAAAVLLLGTTAAATFGNDPVVKINHKRVKSIYSSYVNEDGITIETTAVELPVDYCRYRPAGEIRAACDSDTGEIVCYDELGVRLDKISNWLELFVYMEKEGEMRTLFSRGQADGEHYQGGSMTHDGKEIEIEFWQDPIQALKSAHERKKFERQTVDERLEDFKIYGDPIEYAELGGFKCPTYRELFGAEGIEWGSITSGAATFKTTPSEVLKLYDYAPVSLEGFSEKAETSAFLFANPVCSEEEHRYIYDDNTRVIQQMFVYTLVEDRSGTDVVFTVWRSAKNKDTYTDHFDFDYEYIPLNNGTQARLHQSVYDFYILEFEKDGAAYGLKFDGGRNFAESILQKMGLL